jgi:hypothetical protein
MARRDDRDRIFSVGGADGQKGARIADRNGDLAIGPGWPEWELEELGPVCFWKGVPEKSSGKSNDLRVPAEYSAS